MNVPIETVLVLVAVGLLALGILSTNIALLPVLAFPATLVMVRAGPVSVSDLVLAIALLPAALLYLRGGDASRMRPLMWAALAFQLMLVPTVLLNPYLANLLEWFHVLALVMGGLAVGWVVGRGGYARGALTLYVVGSAGIAAAAVIAGLLMLVQTGSYGEVYLPFLHKNFIGNTLAFAFLMLWLRPDWLRWNRTLALSGMVLCAAGIAASGSRQAMVSVFVVVALLALRRRENGGGRARLLLLACLPAVAYVMYSVRDQLSEANPFNSVAQRLEWFDDSLEIWEVSPIFGVGLRWWYTEEYGGFQPPNAFLEMLSSAGLLGLAGFVVLCVTTLWVVLALPARYGQIAAAVIVARFVQGQLDLFWVAGQAAIPWMMAGLAVGVMAWEKAQPTDAEGGGHEADPARHHTR
ncbi:O-antigen ligase [Nesterenkonia sp. NBAIMH1]|uniref:O-antigen ligase family protein n=1 Tax=Nesterenkonia sp. NBAIMH1 TaxID=2600320 RepID=UPI0011B7F9AD|nr:O-antigen ligase family protein [Nesterenkonia sp. NBAIMH1]